MAVADEANEFGFRGADVRQGLFGLWLREEDHKVNRMAAFERDADLTLGFRPPDSRAMSGAWVDDHIGPARGIRRRSVFWNDAHEGVIHRLGQRSTIHDHLVVEGENRRRAGFFMRNVIVAALTKNVGE